MKKNEIKNAQKMLVEEVRAAVGAKLGKQLRFCFNVHTGGCDIYTPNFQDGKFPKVSISYRDGRYDASNVIPFLK